MAKSRDDSERNLGKHLSEVRAKRIADWYSQNGKTPLRVGKKAYYPSYEDMIDRFGFDGLFN